MKAIIVDFENRLIVKNITRVSYLKIITKFWEISVWDLSLLLDNPLSTFALLSD